MDINDIVAVVDAASKLVGALAWPAVAAFALVRFSGSLKELITHLSKFAFKVRGIEASVETNKAKAEASEALAAAVVAHREPSTPPTAVVQDMKAANTAVEAVTSRTIWRVSGRTVLWVDDRPDNNTNERRALGALGIKVVISTSTEDALQKVQRQKFDLIISDMGRPPDEQAGYTLLDRMRQLGDSTPYVIYAGSRDPQHVAESRRRGALGCTNRPDELLDYVLSALQMRVS